MRTLQNEEKLHLILEDLDSESEAPRKRIQNQKSKKVYLFTIILIVVFLLYASTSEDLKRPSESPPTPSESSEAPTTTTTEPPLPPLKPGVLTDPTRRLTRILPVSHVFITSAYYYPTSKSLGNNSVALTMAVDKKNFDIKKAMYNIVGSNSTDSKFSSVPALYEGVPTCRYTPAMATTQLVANMTKLEMESNGITVQIPFKMARYTAPKPVIICISPQFVAEQWQMFVMHVHVANRFGGHLHMYVTSMIESYFELMKEYERQGYMTLDFWLRMKFSESQTPYFEPNGNIEWRNQAGAETDCLLQYKEAAEYIAFFDMDDILFPKNYPTYLEEFTAEWTTQPNSSALLYGRREHEFIKAETLAEFNFTELVESLKSSPLVKRGKVVVKPERYNSTWIHYSQNVNHTTRHKVESPTLVHVQRPLQKHSKTNNNMTSLWKMEFGPLNETIRDEDVRAIEEDIQRMRNLSVITDIADKLPNADFYLPIVFKCYYDAFYGPVMVEKTGLFNCPNADTCELPQREAFKCVHSDAMYFSGPHMEPFTYHFSNASFWSNDIGCYQ